MSGNAPAIPATAISTALSRSRHASQVSHRSRSASRERERRPAHSIAQEVASLQLQLQMGQLRAQELAIKQEELKREHELRLAQVEIERIKAATDLANAQAAQATASQAAATAAANTTNATNATNATAAPVASPATLSANKIKALQSSLAAMCKLSDRDAYNAWSRKLFQHISSHEMHGYLDGTETVPDPLDRDATDLYRREAKVLSASIIGLLDDKLYPLVAHLGTLPAPKTLWDELEEIFRGKDTNQASMLLSELHRMTLDDDTNPDAWIARIREMYVALKDTKMAQTESSVCQTILEGLPASYREVVLSLQREPDAKWTISHFASVIRQHWTLLARLDARSATGSSNSVGAFAASVSSPFVRPPPVKFKANGQKDPSLVASLGSACRQCAGIGHKLGSRDCPWYTFRVAVGWQSSSLASSTSDKREKKKSKSKQANVAEASGKSSDSVSEVSSAGSNDESSDTVIKEAEAYPASIDGGGVEVYTDFIYTFPAIIECPAPVVAAVAGNSHVDEFLLDTGAQVHLSCIREAFVSLSPLARPLEIRGIGGRVVTAEQQGDIILPINTSGSVFWLKVKNVVYAPDLGRNLISLGRLWRMHKVRLDWETNCLIDRHGESLVQASFANDLWSFPVIRSMMRQDPQVAHALAATDVTVWHKRTNHLGVAGLRALSAAGIVPKLSERDLKAVEECDTCVMGKGARLPFNQSVSKTHRPLELVHSDLCGPISTSVGGYKYFASFIDDYSRLAWVFLLKTKDGFFSAFKHFLAFVERQSGLKLKTLRTDGGDYGS